MGEQVKKKRLEPIEDGAFVTGVVAWGSPWPEPVFGIVICKGCRYETVGITDNDKAKSHRSVTTKNGAALYLVWKIDHDCYSVFTANAVVPMYQKHMTVISHVQ